MIGSSKFLLLISTTHMQLPTITAAPAVTLYTYIGRPLCRMSLDYKDRRLVAGVRALEVERTAELELFRWKKYSVR